MKNLHQLKPLPSQPDSVSQARAHEKRWMPADGRSFVDCSYWPDEIAEAEAEEVETFLAAAA